MKKDATRRHGNRWENLLERKQNGVDLIIVGQNRSRRQFFVSTFINLRFLYFSDTSFA